MLMINFIGGFFFRSRLANLNLNFTKVKIHLNSKWLGSSMFKNERYQRQLFWNPKWELQSSFNICNWRYSTPIYTYRFILQD